LAFNSSNADLGIIVTMTVLTGALALVPSLHSFLAFATKREWFPIHRLIWRRYYASRDGAVRAQSGVVRRYGKGRAKLPFLF
jgi:hypothetical protein